MWRPTTAGLEAGTLLMGDQTDVVAFKPMVEQILKGTLGLG
jgi:hypothetical protein